MYILVKPKPISSKTRVYLVKSYRDVNGTPKHKIIKNYGSYLELIAKDKRIVEKLQIKANRSTALEEQGKKIIIEPTKYGEWNKIYNIGYLFCKACLNVFRPDFVKEIKKLKLGKFYRYILYHMIYNNKIKYQPELYFEGPYYKNLRFPNFHTLQKLTSLVASRITEVQILLLQRMSIYEGNKSNDRLFYLLINSHGFPVYFHLIDLDLHNLSSVLYADIQLLERKFKCKIYIYEHPSITPWLNNIKIYRTYRDYKDNLDMKIKLGLPLDFTKEQLKYLDHTIVGMNKFISGSLITIPPHPTYDDLQLAAFVRVMQMGVFNFFRRLAFSRLNMDYLLQDVQETLRQININGSFENYTNIIVNGSDEEWRSLYYVIFNKKDTLKIIPNAYLNISAFSAQRYTEYIEKHLSKFTIYFRLDE